MTPATQQPTPTVTGEPKTVIPKPSPTVSSTAEGRWVWFRSRMHGWSKPAQAPPLRLRFSGRSWGEAVATPFRQRFCRAG